MVIAASFKQRKSCKTEAQEILEKRGKIVSKYAVRRFREKGLKPFHVIPKPLKTHTLKISCGYVSGFRIGMKLTSFIWPLLMNSLCGASENQIYQYMYTT
jgi:hypothetical protein